MVRHRAAGEQGQMAKIIKIKLVEDDLGDRHRKLTTRELRENLAEALKFTSRHKGTLILTKNGEERAALVSLEDVKVLDAVDALQLKAIILDALANPEIRQALQDESVREALRSALENRLESATASGGAQTEMDEIRHERNLREVGT